MDASAIKSIIESQRQFFQTGQSRDANFRIAQLKKLKSIIQQHENELVAGLNHDLRKSEMEAFFSEIVLVIDEIDYLIKHIPKWTRPEKVRTPFPMLWPGQSEIISEPYGCALIIAPWNYPFILTMSPLIGAISAGNCVIIKPSEISSNTQRVILKMINDNFPANYLFAYDADGKATTELLQEKFDYIFYTGGTEIGKSVMQAAANNLTPLTLELGGKSPCIVDSSANLDFAARRIIWGKMLNAGQTCIAPDYLYVERRCKDELIRKLQQTIKQFYGEQPEASENYGRIINQKHFDRICSLMKNGKIVAGGETNASSRYIAPTIIENVTWQDPIMQEEIFGPILPIITFDSLTDAINIINSHPKPLALYYFTTNKQNENLVLKNISFGGGCINDCILHIANMNLPFGGVGLSGMGNYHGRYSFKTFSHQKSVYRKTLPIDFKLEYPPHSKRKMQWLKKIFSWSF